MKKLFVSLGLALLAPMALAQSCPEKICFIGKPFRRVASLTCRRGISKSCLKNAVRRLTPSSNTKLALEVP